MTADATGPVPDDVIDAVAQAIHANDGTLRSIARDVLSVPAVAAVFARAAEADVYRTALGLACSDGWADGASAMESYIDTARTHLAIHPTEDGAR